MTMLDRMRRHKGWLKWSLALVVLAFVVFYVPDFLDQDPSAAAVGPREAVAEVGGHRITASTFQQRYFARLQRFREEVGGGISDQLLRQLGIGQQTLAQLVDEQVALIEAERHGITVSDEELRQQIYSYPVMRDEEGRFIGQARYRELLQFQSPPMTPAQFEETLRREMIISKLRAALTDWMTVSDDEVEREYRQRNERIQLELVALSPDQFRDKVAVTDEDVAAYFESRQAEYRIGEQRRIRYVLVDRERERQQVNVSFDEVQRFYNENTGLYRTPEQVRARHILFETAGRDEAVVREEAEAVLQQVQAGGDFEALAREHSDDLGSAERGGDLDYFGRGQMVPEFEDMAFSLQPGQVSGLVHSQFGFHIIQVVDRRPEQTPSLEEVRAEIEEQLLAQRTEQLVQDRARQVAERVTTPADMAAAASALGLEVEESGYFQREDPVPGLGAAPQVAATAFVLGENEVSEAIATPRGMAVIAVLDRRDPYVPPLEDVRDRVRDDLIRTRATELSRERAGDVARTLREARNFAAAAKTQGFEVQESGWITRDSPLPGVGFSAEVDRVAFALPVEGVSEPILTGDTSVIVRVTAREDVTPEQFERARERFRSELLTERRNRFFTAYMSQVRNRMTIRTYLDVVQRITG